MKVLHLSNSFPRNKLYAQLFWNLDKLGIEQEVYSAVRTQKETEIEYDFLRNIRTHVHLILAKKDRLFFRSKINKIYNNITSVTDFSSIDVVHAHTLYSDGAVALKIKQYFNKPFVVTLRNTDMYKFPTYRPDLNRLRNTILQNAERVFVLSPMYREVLLRKLPSKVAHEIQQKLNIVPNGVDDFWLDNSYSLKRKNTTLKVLFVGHFTENKNTEKLIKAVYKIAQHRSIKLTLVGGGRDKHNRIVSMVESGEYPFARYLGRIEDNRVLMEIYREHDMLVVPSYRETFGLVYIEALSQGLPIIHSKGQGVDGYFQKNTVAESVDPKNENDIAEKILILSKRMEDVRKNCAYEASKFRWSHIAEEYIRWYSV